MDNAPGPEAGRSPGAPASDPPSAPCHGFLVYFPENHGAMLGATRMAQDCIPLANAAGYSPEICSYLTSDVGSCIKGETPMSRAYPGIKSPPRPDVLVYNTNQCKDVQDWFSWYAGKFKVPMLGICTPRGVNEVTSAHTDSVAAQLAALVPKLEEISGNKFDLDKLKEVVSLSLDCSRLWRQVLETAGNVPPHSPSLTRPSRWARRWFYGEQSRLRITIKLFSRSSRPG